MEKFLPTTRLIVPLGVALAVLLVGTVIQGQMSERWGMGSEKLDQFTARMDPEEFPKQFHVWTGKDGEVDKAQIRKAKITSYVQREYTNHDGDLVSVFMATGTARNITLHSPDWCYRAAGFKQVGDKQKVFIKIDHPSIQGAEFAAATFRRVTPTGVEWLRIFWSFSEDGQWNGPKFPRSHYGPRPALHKIYLIAPIEAAARSQPPEHTINADFARHFMPIVQQQLFGDESSPELDETKTAAAD